MPAVYLLVSLVGAWFTFNAYNPMFARHHRATISFFAGWLTAELALHQIAWQVLASVFFVWRGALSEWPGWLGLGISLGSWIALAALYRRAREAEVVVEDALCRGLGPSYRDEILPHLAQRLPETIEWREILLPFPMRNPLVERLRCIPYTRAGGRDLVLDIYRPRDRELVPDRGCPVLLQIHGGGWVVGSRSDQGIPLMLRMASHGWVCVSIDYRLSPRATFPDHIVDVKRAIEWVKEHVREYGGDPDFLVLTGGSAGGHLASLAGLTANAAEFQPGFEEADTTVQACVSFYGVYDFTNRNGVYLNEGLARLLRRWVMKAALEEARERYEQASPLYRIHRDAPAFFVTHGDRDTLVPVAEARHFVAALREVSRAPVVYAEIPAAQHAFEIFPSLRSALAIDGVERFLFHAYSRYLGAANAARRQATGRDGEVRSAALS